MLIKKLKKCVIKYKNIIKNRNINCQYKLYACLKRYVFNFELKGWRNKALSDFRCKVKFSFCFTSESKEIWKENLAIYQKSLSAFFQAPLQLETVTFRLGRISRRSLFHRNGPERAKAPSPFEGLMIGPWHNEKALRSASDELQQTLLAGDLLYTPRLGY